ncbi:hypothetical protein KSP39_PZI014334 [Platanthera zijinensis]|uniref:Uncharacterized protein n=1 Tax=Platanthera zijinensis TaxID=2320716 RepID=A0AAP0BAU2_9ASPA
MAISQATISVMKFDAGFDIDMESFSNSDQVFQDILKFFEGSNLQYFMITRIKLPVLEIKEWMHTTTLQDTPVLIGSIFGNQVRASLVLSKPMSHAALSFRLLKIKSSPIPHDAAQPSLMQPEPT